MLNAHYDSHEKYLDAIAREMEKEYQAIHEAGLILQIDAPDLAMDRTMMYRDLSDVEFVKACESHVAAINKGIDGIPRDRVRLHVCYGNWEGPHIHDMPLATFCRRSIRRRSARSRSSFPTRAMRTNMSVKKVPLPKDMILIPGVIEIDHEFRRAPRSGGAADRGSRRSVGDRERVIASTDCGFGTFT